jgi:hypothetical protein
MLSSQSGSDDLPKPGCDGAITAIRACARNNIEGDAPAAMQIKQRRALPLLEEI